VARLRDFAIWHLVPTAEEWLPVKTEPDFGIGGNDDDALVALFPWALFWE
jgi:hypothetical protein